MRLVLLILLAVPVIAHAEPTSFFAAIGSIIGVSGTVVQIGLTIGLAIYGAAQQRKAKLQAEQDARNAHNASLEDRSVTRVGTDSPYLYVYGRARVGSTIVGMFTSGDKDQYKHLVCVHAAHECDAVEEIYIAGKPLGVLDGSGYVTGGDYYQITTGSVIAENHTGLTFNLAHVPISLSVIFNPPVSTQDVNFPASANFSLSGTTVTLLDSYTNDGAFVSAADVARAGVVCAYQYLIGTPHVNVQVHLGTSSDPVDGTLQSAIGTALWPSTSVLRGFCYTVVMLDLNVPEFQSGIPSIEVLLRGKKIYDPRTTLTQWSQNNALVIMDYLTSEFCGVPYSDLPEDDYITAANVCDEPQTFGDLYNFNGTVNSEEDRRQVLERMAQSMAGGIVGTSWRVWAGKYIAPVMNLSQSDVVGKWSITPGVSDADLFNGVRGQYISAENSYVPTDFVPFQNATYAAADGSDLWSNIDFPYTNTAQRVHNLARIFVEDQRNGFIFKGEFSLKAWDLKIGQRAAFTSPFVGQSGKIYRVTDKSFSPTAAVELTLKEDAASIFDFADSVSLDDTPNTNLENPFQSVPLQSLTCESGTNVLLLQSDGTIVSRILVTWPVVTSQAVFTAGLIEVEWAQVGVDVWQKVTVSGSDTSVYLSPVQDGYFYTVRARTVNPYLNVKSDWIVADIHRVIGKTGPPPDIVDLSISGSVLNWTGVFATDLAGYRFRFNYGNNEDWGAAVPLHQGLVLAGPFDMITRPTGVVTIMGKAVDTTGNESQNAAVIVTDLGDPFVANVVEVIDLDALGYPGTLTSCTLSGGNLIADALDSFYGTDSQSFFGLDNDPFYDNGAYAEMVYVTSEIQIATALVGSVMTLDINYVGADLRIDYRTAGPNPFYGQDTDSFYGLDTDPFYEAPGSWIPWPGQIFASNDVYQFQVTIGAGVIQGEISAMALTIDAPDIIEYVNDLAISASGTAIPYTSNFTSIKSVQATLQANVSGAETIEINKTSPLAPSAKAYNSSHVAVSGATGDFTLKGY